MSKVSHANHAIKLSKLELSVFYYEINPNLFYEPPFSTDPPGKELYYNETISTLFFFFFNIYQVKYCGETKAFH